MPALKQIRAIFSPILAEHPDLVLCRRWLIKPPVRMAVTALHIGERLVASELKLTLTVVPLSRFLRPSSLGYYEPFTVEDAPGSASPTDEQPDLLFDAFAPDYPRHLLENFNAKGRAMLDGYRDFGDIVSWLARFRHFPRQMGPIELIDAWIATMEGDFAAGAALLETLLARMEPAPAGPAGENHRLQADICRLLRTGDPTAIATFLHDLERRTVTAYGLARHWQPTPFPFERPSPS